MPAALSAGVCGAVPMPERQREPLRVLLIGDEEEVARAITRGLARAGLSVAWASRGGDGLALKDSFRPRVALANLILPDMHGWPLVALLRRPRDCGVVVLSGMGGEAGQAVQGLGADDSIAKPSSMREMIARIQAIHERVAGTRAATPGASAG